MALTLADRVQETTTTTGTGTVTLLGAVTGYQSFAAVGNANTTYYCIAGLGTAEWEVGIGTYTSSGTTLARTTVLASSNSGSLVSFSAGTKSVFVTYPSEKSVNLDASGNATALGTPVAFNGANITGIPLANLSTVSLSTPLQDQLLGYNGTSWVNVAANSAGAGTGVVFYNASPVITASGTQNLIQIDTLATIPVVTAEQTVTGQANLASGAVLFSAFVSTALGRTVIDAGVWDFVSWIGVDATVGTNTVTRQIYTALPLVTGTVTMTGTGTTRTATASAGTPFATSVIDASATSTTASYLQTPSGLYQITARTSDTVVTIGNLPSTYTNESAVAGTVWKKLFGVTTGDINDTSPNYGLYEVTVTAGSYAITAATKVGILGFFTSDTPVTLHTVTITYDGTTRNTHVNTPLANLHNQLAGLNGGVANEYYHSTSAEYTGTGTGVFVRATSPTLVTPALGTPTALVGTNITGTATAFTASNVTTNANLTGGVTSVGNAATVVTNANLTGGVTSVGNAATVITNANLTGGVTSVGNAATVVTNANLTGGVTSVGNATTVITNANLTGGVTSVGNAATVVTNANLTGEATSVGNAATLTNSAVIGKVLTGYVSGAGTVSATDSILTAIQKLNGNAASSVSSISFASTGLTPATATTGAVTVGGTLSAGYGGTGVAGSLTGIPYMNGSSAYTAASTAQALTLIGTVPIANGGTNIVTYTTGDILYSSSTNILSKLASTTSGYLLTAGGVGVAPSWAAPAAATVTLSNDTATATPIYPLLATATTGTTSTVYTSNSNYLYTPSTGALQAKEVVASNGLFVNNLTVGSNYTIPTGYSASSVGPITVSGGVAVTIPSGSRWVVL